MNLPIERTIQFGRKAKGRRALETPRTAHRPCMPTGRIPRVSRLLALAHRLDRYLRDGVVANHSDLAQLGHVSRARISQILNLINLAPDLQEAILFLPPSTGPAPLILHDLQPIASTLDWTTQRQLWARLLWSSEFSRAVVRPQRESKS